MPRVMTNTCGIPKIRKTLNSVKCLVVMLNKTANDTDVITRATNNDAPDRPWRVIISFKPITLKINITSPGVKTLNIAGIAIKSENIGINIHVLFKKKPI